MNNLIEKLKTNPNKILNVFAIFLPIITCLLTGMIILIFNWAFYVFYFLIFILIIYFVLMGMSIKIKNIKKYNIYNLIICIVLFVFLLPILEFILPFFLDRPALDGWGDLAFAFMVYLPCVTMGAIDIISLIICFIIRLIKKIRGR